MFSTLAGMISALVVPAERLMQLQSSYFERLKGYVNRSRPCTPHQALCKVTKLKLL